jgi:hypothetical protein
LADVFRRLQARRPHMSRGLVGSVFALALACTGLSGAWALSSAPKLDAASRAPSACRTDPHQGVHDPTRLTLLSACVQVQGTVIRIPKVPPDGDHTFNVRLDPAYVGMMNAQNVADGGLHIEIVPMDQPGCTPGQPIEKPAGYNNLGVCSGANVETPALGARVRITGPYVHDDWSGPNEIHPAWQVDVLAADTPPVTTTIAVTTTSAKPPPPKPLVLKARLSGRAIVGAEGALHGAAAVVLTITPPKLCWRFTSVLNVGSPTRARISRGSAGHNGRQLVPLGATYRARGCRTADADNVLEPLGERPSQYYVTLLSKAFPAGAVRSQLSKAQP